MIMLPAWLRSTSVAIIVSIAIAIVLGGLVVALSGSNPLAVYLEILRGSVSGSGLATTLTRAVSLVGMALAASIPLRAGVVNLGGDGQLLVGALVGAIVALYLPAPGIIRITVAIVAAMLAGGGYAAVAGLLQTVLGIPLLIGSLLMSYIAIGITSFIVRFPLRDPKSGLPETHRILTEARLPSSVFGLPISAGLILMAIVALIVIVNDRRGVIGLDMRMRGGNPEFARYTGVHLPRQTVGLAFASGAVAGLVGVLLILGSQYRFTDGALLVANYTWSGLLAAILAAGNPIAAIIAGAFFAALQVGGFSMERSLGLPSVLTQILQALIIICLAMRGGFIGRRT